MNNLIDTNVLSELRKRDRCHPNVINWSRNSIPSNNFVGVLVLGEIRSGIAQRARYDLAQAAVYESWLERLKGEYRDRIIPVDAEIAEVWGRLQAIRPLPIMDALMAATAIVRDLTFVTRDVNDLRGVGVRLLNPFEK